MGIVALGLAVLLLPAEPVSAQVPAGCPAALRTADIVGHDLRVSFCELCDVGDVRIVIENPFGRADDIDFTDLVVTEDLMASGLTYVPGSTSFSGSNIVVPANEEPSVGGPNGSVLTWDLTGDLTMDARRGRRRNRAVLVIDFQVRRHATLSEEGLVSANRMIDASVELEPSCATVPGDRFTTSGHRHRHGCAFLLHGI